jgi:hypothetical protein
MNDFQLSETDKASGLWLRLKEHFEERIAAARQRNDNIQSDADTAALRGEIRALKRLVRLGEDRPFLDGNDDQPR